MPKSRAIFVLLTGIVLINSFAYMGGAITLDSARDIQRALDIAKGMSFPLVGPDIGGFFHAGPIWFYFLSVPALSGSLVVVSLWVGFFASLKFVFAYLLGKELIDRKFGLLWSVYLLLPGWKTIDQFVIRHTNVVETLCLLLLLLLLRYYKYGNSKYLLFSVLVLSLAVHAHPSSVILGVMFVPGLVKHFKKLNLRIIIFSTVLFLLPFIPYVVEQFLLGFPDIQKILSFSSLNELMDFHGKNISKSDGFFNSFTAIWNAIFILGPQRISQFTSMQLPVGGNLIILVHFFLVLLYLTGSIIQFKHAKQQMKMNLIFIGLIFVLIMELVLLRPFTPFYMLLSITPFVAGLLAIGSYGLFKKLNFNYLYLLAVIVLSIAFLPTVALYKTMKKDQINLGPVRNVQVAAPKNWQTREKTIDVVSIIDSEKIAQLICETDSTTIHGPLAVVLDYTSAVILELFCQSHQLYLGGYTDTNSKHLFFMHRSFWNKTKLQPEQWVTESWGMTTQFDHLPIAKRLKIAPFDDYVHPPRISTDKPATQIFSYRFKTQRNAYLSITNMLPFYFRVKVIKVSANQFEQNSLMKNVGNTLYFCNECKAEEVFWQLEIETNNQSVLDINSLYW